MIWKLSFFQWTPSIELNKLKLDYHCEVSLFQWIFISRFYVAFICLSHSLQWWHLTSGYGWFESYFLQLAAIRFSINELPINFYFFLHCCAISISLFSFKIKLLLIIIIINSQIIFSAKKGGQFANKKLRGCNRKIFHKMY